MPKPTFKEKPKPAKPNTTPVKSTRYKPPYPRMLTSFTCGIVAVNKNKHELLFQGNFDHPHNPELSKEDYDLILDASKRFVESLKLHNRLVKHQLSKDQRSAR